jgi:hypothetical protein
MAIIKRLCSVKVVAIGALFLLIAGALLSVRGVMALNLELGMDREHVIRVMGKPHRHQDWTVCQIDLWDSIVLNEGVYAHCTAVEYKNGKAKAIMVWNIVLGHTFTFLRHLE